jgi:uncharacterized protein (DUF58 family)
LAKKVKKIELNSRKNSSAALQSVYRSRFRGQGMQVVDSRDYQSGDDIRHIDWRMSARTPKKMVKIFEEDRELNIIMMVDTSQSLQYGTTGDTKFETLACMLATIGFAAAKNNDRIGLMLFSDTVERYEAPKKGSRHVRRLLDALLRAPARAASANLEIALQQALMRVPSNAVVILASDMFLNLDVAILSRCSRKFDLIFCRVLDPNDGLVPTVGLVQFTDLETGQTLTVDTSSKAFRQQHQAGQAAWEANYRKQRAKYRAGSLDIFCAEDPSRALTLFLKSRKRR